MKKFCPFNSKNVTIEQLIIVLYSFAFLCWSAYDSQILQYNLCSIQLKRFTILFRPIWFNCSQDFKLFDFPIFWFERTWWWLFQKRVVRTKFDIYVFINIYLAILLFIQSFPRNMNNVGSKEVGVILFVDLPIPTKCEMYVSSNTTSYFLTKFKCSQTNKKVYLCRY
jgi:hypothetical protein